MMSRLKAGLDTEDLLAESPGGISSDLHALHPPLFRLSLDHLDRGDRVAREEVFLGKRKEKGKVISKESAQIRAGSSMQETKKTKFTIDQVFNAAEAGRPMGFPVGPGGALDLKLGEEVGLLRLHLQLGRLKGLRLFSKLSDQPVPLFGQLVALRLLATQGSVGFAQLLLLGSVGLCKKKEERISVK